MAVGIPLFLNGVDYNAESERRGLSGLVVQSSAGVARTGVLGPIPDVSLSGSTVKVGAFSAVIGSAKGPYLVPVDSVNDAEGTVVPSDATNGRLDRVVLEVLDPDNGTTGTTLRKGRLRVITGQAAALPSLPAQPPLSLHVAQIQVPRSGAGAPAVTVDCPLTAAAGAPIPVRSATERNALPKTEGLRAQIIGSTSVDIVRSGAWIEGDTGWIKLNPVQGFDSYEPDGWGGVWFRCKNDYVTITGAVTRGTAWSAGQVVVALDSRWRPPRQIQGVNCIAQPADNGGLDVKISAGSGPVSFNVSYPL